jgi:hypothetical protein
VWGLSVLPFGLPPLSSSVHLIAESRYSSAAGGRPFRLLRSSGELLV